MPVTASARPTYGRITQHARDPREQVPAIDELFADGSERPGDGERDEQNVDVARQRGKEADVGSLPVSRAIAGSAT